MSAPYFDGVTITVEVAFGDDPLAAAPTWTDVTEWVRGYNTFRGRSSEFAPYAPGRLSITLDNNDRRFDPEHADSPYAGELLPMKRMRVLAGIGGVTYALFTGYVLGWPQQWRDSIDGTVSITCVDGSRFLERSPLAQSALAAEILADDPMVYWPLQPVGGGSSFPAAVGVSDMTAGSGSVVSSRDTGAPLGQPLGVSAVLSRSDQVGLTGQLNAASLMPSPPAAVEGWFTIAGPTDFGWTALAFSAGIAPYRAFQVLFQGATGQMLVSYADGDGAYYENLGVADKALPLGVAHVVGTIDDGDVVVFVNAREVFRAALTASTPAGVEVVPGAVVSPGVDRLGAVNTVSHVAAYASPLSAARIRAHYEAGVRAWGHPYGERSGARCERVLDEVGWPGELRSIDVGDTVHGPYLPGAQSALGYMRSVETAEDGALFFAADGRLVLRGRQAKWDGPKLAVLLADDGVPLLGDDDELLTSDEPITFSDNDTGVPFADIELDSNSVDPIRNIVASSYQTGYLKVDDTVSRTAYGDQDETLSLPTVDSATTARGIASYRLRQRKDPQTRIPQLTIRPRTLPAESFHAVLGLELGDLIRVRFTPRQIGDPIVKTLAVQGIAHDVRPGGEWTTVLYVSPADDSAVDRPYLVVGDATLGRIGADAGNRIPF